MCEIVGSGQAVRCCHVGSETIHLHHVVVLQRDMFDRQMSKNVFSSFEQSAFSAIRRVNRVTTHSIAKDDVEISTYN